MTIEAASSAQPRDVYRGYTYKRLLSELLAQDGADSDHTDEELEEFRGWILEGVDQVRGEVPEEHGRRSSALEVVAGISRYYLDYDVEQLIGITASDGQSVRAFDMREYQEHKAARGGTDFSETSLVLEDRTDDGRWIVRVIPAPVAAATLTILYVGATPNVAADGEAYLPLPARFHPAARHYAKIELYARQEDFRAKEDAMRDFELSIQRARAAYKPLLNVQEGFRSIYDTPSPTARGFGRIDP